jgi:hypothetical protein
MAVALILPSRMILRGPPPAGDVRMGPIAMTDRPF